MISRYDPTPIRIFEYTVGLIDPDPNDEREFMAEVAEAAR